MPKIVQLAKEMQDQFKLIRREDGSEIWVLKDDHPEWMQDVMYAAHSDGASLPDDTVYDLAHDCINAIAECDKEDDADTLRDAIDEIEPEYRTWQLFTWAARWSEYIDEVCSEFGGTMIKSSSELEAMLRMAQSLQIERIGGLIIEALEELASDDDEEEEPEEVEGVDDATDLPKFPFNAHVRILQSTYYSGWTGRVIANNTRYASGEWVYTVRLDDTGDEFDHGESNLDWA